MKGPQPLTFLWEVLCVPLFFKTPWESNAFGKGKNCQDVCIILPSDPCLSKLQIALLKG